MRLARRYSRRATDEGWETEGVGPVNQRCHKYREVLLTRSTPPTTRQPIK